MFPSWQSWCRLCANEDPGKMNTNFHLRNDLDSTYLDAINKHFSIDVNLDQWPQTICTRCHQYVVDLINFAQRTSKVQIMFAELLNNNEELNMEKLRAKYRFYDLENEKLETKESKAFIGDFEFIADDMQHIKAEQADEGEECSAPGRAEPEDDSSSDEERLMKTTKCKEEEDEDSEEHSRIKKRGRPRKKPEFFICASCQEKFPSHAKFAHHMRELHGMTPDPLPYTCSKCNKSFATKKACKEHETTHESAEQQPTTCPYCNKGFKKSKLRGHIRQMHVGEKPFVCDDCGKAYTTFGNLKEHKLTHSEERPFKCRYCEKCFKNKPRLRTHEDTHNDTNYICTSCGLQLNTRRTLKMHMLVHSDQKQHKCDFCGKEYKRAKNLKVHLIMHTGLKSYMCTFCDKTFTSNANCRIHMKKNHPTELAELEASGTKIVNSNIPKMEDLRAVISKKSIMKESMGSMEYRSMGNDLKLLSGNSQASTTRTEQSSNQQENSYISPNKKRIAYGQMHGG